MATMRGGICKTRLHSLITNHPATKIKFSERGGNPSFVTLSPSFCPSPSSLCVVCHFSRGGWRPPESHDPRAGFPESPNIHQLVLSGDLFVLRKKLQEKPSLIHDRNAIIVKLLLDWRGTEKVELEAKNMYRQTPLHTAAKNGRIDAAKVLLDHGAIVEAKDDNGMTPLHVAVCYAYRAAFSPNVEYNGDHFLTVKTLLEYNADCSAKDNEGFTPLNHLSLGPQGEKMRELFHLHIEQKKRSEAIGPRGDMKENMDKIEETLANLVGLHELKLQLRKWAKGMLLDEKRRALGLKVAARKPPHMAFLGNPGTGKTMVARILGRLLYMVGILPTDIVTEVQRSDLIGEYIGYTGPKTRRKIKEAEGGILFVDEAYRLIPSLNSDDKDYGLEALEEIMSVMDSGKVVVIFAGYSEPMNRVISSNEGFRRRVTKFFFFSDFSSKELAQMLLLNLKNQEECSSLYGFKLHPSCTVDAITYLIEKGTTEKQRKEMNGGLIDSLLVNARENLDLRLDSDSEDADKLITITLKDLEAGLRSLSQ